MVRMAMETFTSTASCRGLEHEARFTKTIGESEGQVVVFVGVVDGGLEVNGNGFVISNFGGNVNGNESIIHKMRRLAVEFHTSKTASVQHSGCSAAAMERKDGKRRPRRIMSSETCATICCKTSRTTSRGAHR